MFNNSQTGEPKHFPFKSMQKNACQKRTKHILSGNANECEIIVHKCDQGSNLEIEYELSLSLGEHDKATLFFSSDFVQQICDAFSIKNVPTEAKKVEIIIHAFFGMYFDEIENITGQELITEITEASNVQPNFEIELYTLSIKSTSSQIGVFIEKNKIKNIFRDFFNKSSLIDFSEPKVGSTLDLKIAMAIAKESFIEGTVFKIDDEQLILILDNQYFIPASLIRSNMLIETAVESEFCHKISDTDFIFACFQEFKSIGQSSIASSLRDTVNSINQGKINSCKFDGQTSILVGEIAIHEAKPYLITKAGT